MSDIRHRNVDIANNTSFTTAAILNLTNGLDYGTFSKVHSYKFRLSILISCAAQTKPTPVRVFLIQKGQLTVPTVTSIASDWLRTLPFPDYNVIFDEVFLINPVPSISTASSLASLTNYDSSAMPLYQNPGMPGSNNTGPSSSGVFIDRTVVLDQDDPILNVNPFMLYYSTMNGSVSNPISIQGRITYSYRLFT